LSADSNNKASFLERINSKVAPSPFLCFGYKKLRSERKVLQKLTSMKLNFYTTSTIIDIKMESN
jgi:hypothetical protein